MASYAFLAMVVGVFWGVWWVGEILNPSPPKLALAGAAGSLRTINTAEITYAGTYGRGYSPTLASLRLPADNANPTAEAAGLIPDDLAGATHNGYRFVYSAGPPDADGKIQTYAVSAMPIRPEWRLPYYFTDQTGVIRMNATRPASATDPPIGG